MLTGIATSMVETMDGACSQPLISHAHDECFTSLKNLLAAIQDPVHDFHGQISPENVENDFDRYRIWASNVGAMHRGRRYEISLDYRLSEAAFYKQQVMSLPIPAA